MQIPYFEAGDFGKKVLAGDFKKALQTLVGTGDKGVVLARALVNAVYELAPTDQEKLLEWCKAPMEPQPIGELQWYLDQIARHEMGHAVAARVLGFKTGAITLVLKDPNGTHEATAATPLDRPTLNATELKDYLERRVMLLMAGTMAEADSVDKLWPEFFPAWDGEAALSDRQKTDELIQVLMNMSGGGDLLETSRCSRNLAAKTLQIVGFHYALIARIALALSGKIKDFGQLAKLSNDEFELLLGSDGLINPLG